MHRLWLASIGFVLTVASMSCGDQLSIPATKAAVLVKDEEPLQASDVLLLKVLTEKCLQKSGKFQILDSKSLDLMMREQIVKALIEGREADIGLLVDKYRVDVVVCLGGSVEVRQTLGGYFLGTATTWLRFLRQNTHAVTLQAASDPQGAGYSVPAWIGETELAARQMALTAAVVDVLRQAGLQGLEMPVPDRVRIKLQPSNLPPETVSFLKKGVLSVEQAEQLAAVSPDTIGRRTKLTCIRADLEHRIGAVGVNVIDIDLQRGSRQDNASVRFFDIAQRREIRQWLLPLDVQGIRRPKHRHVVDCCLGPTGRFVALISAHPALWIYDLWSGQVLANQALITGTPREVALSDSGDYVRVVSTKGDSQLFRLTKSQ